MTNGNGNGVRKFWSDTRIHIAIVLLAVSAIVNGVTANVEIRNLAKDIARIETKLADPWTATDHDRYAITQVEIDRLQTDMLKELRKEMAALRGEQGR